MANIIVGSFVTGNGDNTAIKTGKALSYVTEINGDYMTLKVIASPNDNINGDGLFTSRLIENYVPVTVDGYINIYGADNLHFMAWFEEYAMKEVYGEINVGAFVICVRDDEYAYTNEKTLCLVTGITNADERNMRVRCIMTDHNTGRGSAFAANENYSVKQKYFSTISMEKYLEMFPDACYTYDAKDYIWKGYYVSDPVNFNHKENMHLERFDYVPTDEVVEDIVNKMHYIYNGNDYGVYKDALREDVKASNTAKRHLMGLFSLHKDWDAKNLRIHLKEETYERKMSYKQASEFVDWVRNELGKIYEAKKITICGMNYDEVHYAVRKMQKICTAMANLQNISDGKSIYDDTKIVTTKVNGLTYGYYFAELERLEAIKEEFDNNFKYLGDVGIYATEKDWAEYKAYDNLLEEMRNAVSMKQHLLTAERAEKVNDILSPLKKANGRQMFRVSENQKWSRVISKVSHYYGLDKIKHVETKVATYHDLRGREHTVTRTKDTGWASKFAQFADAVNPLKVKMDTFISLNPLDFMLMSNGTNWTSCHHLSKYRDCRTGDYTGCYSGGANGLSKDEVTVVMFTTKKCKHESDYTFIPKNQRCLFQIGKDKLIQGRVYPDGRDGATSNARDIFRQVLQRVITECLDVPNLWELVQTDSTKSIYSTEVIDKYVIGAGDHYEDYLHYDDSTISFLHDGDKRKNSERITIGHPQTCPICGKFHRDDEDFVYCAEHRHMFNKVDECDIFTDESPILSSEIRENWEKKLDDVRTRRDGRNGDFF